jgi:hypothetical protein
MRSLATVVTKPGHKGNRWPVQQTTRREHSLSSGADSAGIVADMVSVLSNNEHGSTAEALAFLRQLYPRCPLTLRLAAIVAHSKAQPRMQFQFGLERPVAQ